MKIQYHCLMSNHKKEDAVYESPQGQKISFYKEFEEWVTLDSLQFNHWKNNHPNGDNFIKIIDKKCWEDND